MEKIDMQFFPFFVLYGGVFLSPAPISFSFLRLSFPRFLSQMDPVKSVITLTFGDSAENHVGMEKIGKMVAAGAGFTVAELVEIQKKFADAGMACELHRLDSEDKPEAAVLVLRDGVNYALGGADGHGSLFAEQAVLEVDRKAFMYGRVVNKHARWNLCFDTVGHEPDYAHGKGRIVPYSDIPITARLLSRLPEMFGEKAADLKCEANYYYDISKCGIGFHGDSERRKVVGVRLGAAMEMHWQWFKDGAAVGDRIRVRLNGGDIYIMSEKAVGTDWKKKSMYTLRHATGCDKFTTIDEK